MKLYKFEQRYDEETGKKSKKKKPILDKLICDYCGAILDPEDYNENPDPSYRIEESGDIEQSYYEIEVPKGVDKFKLFGEQNSFHFCPEWGTGRDCEFDLMKEWVANHTKGDFCEISRIAEVMYISRLRVLKNLLKNGHKLKHFQIEKEEN